MALLLAAAVAGCDEMPTPAAPTEQLSQEKIARAVAALGFSSSTIQDRGDYVRVEGDIRLSKARLASGEVSKPGSAAPRSTLGPTAPRFQFHHPNLVDQPLIHHIGVNLNGWPEHTQEAARAAMVEWNKVQGSYIRMFEAWPGNLQVKLDCWKYDTKVPADTEWPEGGQPGKIVLNMCYDGPPLTKGEYRALFLHHLGHAIGFQHTDWTKDQVPISDAVHIPGTPYSGGDDASIMMRRENNLELSHYDRVMAARVYPLPPPTVTVVNLNGTPRISWNYPFAADGRYSVRLLHNRYERYGRLPPETINEVTLLEEGVGKTQFDDIGHHWTGTSSCNTMTSTYTRKEAWLYEVTIHYANGATGATWHAPVGKC